ncbi:MAG: hypothetical protein EBX97_04595 [Actinobacteria bacterium]|jgi:hypothetical protein|nr:hypothetical protein [Actinomycetota bacterium]
MNRILRVGIQQGIRSITLIILPIAFISLVAWATAGSSSGNTADPLRAAFWFFLAAHQVPLQLSLSDSTSSGSLTFLPIGALLIPFFALRSGFLRMTETLGAPKSSRDKRNYILVLALSYSLISYLFALPTLGGTVKAPFYLAIPVLLIVAYISIFIASGALPNHKLQFPWQRALRLAWIIVVALIGIGSILLSASLIYHFEVVLNLTRVVEPGIFGGLVLLLGQILYIPNISVSALSYVAGSGVSIGAGSLLSPFTHRIDEIPAIPILGALPTNSHSLVFLFAALVVALGTFAASYGRRTYADLVEVKRFYFSLTLILFALLFIISRATSGELLSSNLSSVGPIWWALPIVVTLEILAGGAFYIYAPKLLTKIRNRNA